MSKHKCCCCGRDARLVGFSSLDRMNIVQYPYCEECAYTGAEPAAVVEETLWMCNYQVADELMDSTMVWYEGRYITMREYSKFKFVEKKIKEMEEECKEYLRSCK